MDEKIKDYVENCIEMVKLDIKMHKLFKDYDKPNFWLKYAEKNISNIETALKYNMLPSEKQKEKEWWDELRRKMKEPKKLVKVELI